MPVPLVRQGKSRRQLQDTLAHGASGVKVLYVQQDLRDHVSNRRHFGFFHTAGGNGGGAQTYAAGLEGRAGFERTGVRVDGDTGFVQRNLAFFARYTASADIDHHQVVVGAAADESVTVSFHSFGKAVGVLDDLLLLVFEFGLQRFVEADGLGRDDVHVGAALDSGEGLGVDFFGVFFGAED